jgi:hypothetical protein
MKIVIPILAQNVNIFVSFCITLKIGYDIFNVSDSLAANVHGFGLVWNFPTVRPEPLPIILFS